MRPSPKPALSTSTARSRSACEASMECPLSPYPGCGGPPCPYQTGDGPPCPRQDGTPPGPCRACASFGPSPGCHDGYDTGAPPPKDWASIMLQRGISGIGSRHGKSRRAATPEGDRPSTQATRLLVVRTVVVV